jgi:hypothetical protein
MYTASYTDSGVKRHKAKLSLCLLKHHAMKTYGADGAQLHVFLTSAQDEGNWQDSSPGRFTAGDNTQYTLHEAMRDTAWTILKKEKSLVPAGNLTLAPQ